MGLKVITKIVTSDHRKADRTCEICKRYGSPHDGSPCGWCGRQAEATSWGVDAYSRYEERNGVRYAVEPWPKELGWSYRLNFRARIRARLGIVRWYWHTRHNRE